MNVFQKSFLLLRNIPFMARAFSRLADETSASNWDEVVAILEEMHGRGLGSDDTHHRLGCAYVMLERYGDACQEFEQIRESLPSDREEARRFFNYSLALCKCDRRDEAIGVLDTVSPEDWPRHLKSKRAQLWQHLKEGDVPPPAIQ